MSDTSLLEQRRNRVLQAVALKKPDRVPVAMLYTGFAAYVTATPMCEFVESPAKATETMLRAYDLIGDADAMDCGTFFPYGLCFIYGAKVKVPGVDRPDNETWQVLESEVMKVEDYDRILDLGWTAYFQDFIAERILDDVPPEFMAKSGAPVDVAGEWAARGVPVLTGGHVTTPYELLCGSRSLENFTFDMFDIPGKVEAAMEAMVPHLAGPACMSAKVQNCPAVWIGGWRAAPSMLSPAMWDRFVWPYFKRLVEEVVAAGLIAILHLDSKWDRELPRLRELPRGRCILAADGETDLYKAKEVLGGHMCLMGDVPASMLFMNSAEEVYDYSTKLIRDLGPEGFILHSGCDIPANAKLENVQAMVAAALAA